jgi:DnaK suppressor protein
MSVAEDFSSDWSDEYRPSEKEPYMNPKMLEYFRRKLLSWKQDILAESKLTLVNLQSENDPLADLVDRASSETDRTLELRTRDRQRKLISKIDSALRRIDEGEYGYCRETGEPIGVGRLEARPTATLSVEAQEAHERNEKVHRDD